MVENASTDLQSNYVEHVSAQCFAATVSRLEQVIAQAGLTIFARIDHQGVARDVGLNMPPTLVLIYGNPARRHADHAGIAESRARPAAARARAGGRRRPRACRLPSHRRGLAGRWRPRRSRSASRARTNPAYRKRKVMTEVVLQPGGAPASATAPVRYKLSLDYLPRRPIRLGDGPDRAQRRLAPRQRSLRHAALDRDGDRGDRRHRFRGSRRRLRHQGGDCT